MRILGYAGSTLALAGILAFSSPAQSQWPFWDGTGAYHGQKNNHRKAKLSKRPTPLNLESIVQSGQAIPKSDILFTSTNDFDPGIPSDIRATFHLTREDLYPATHGKANAKLFSEYLSMLNSKIPQSNQALAPNRNRLLRQAELYFGLGKSIQTKILQSTGTLIFGDRLMQLVDRYRPMLENGHAVDVEYAIPAHLMRPVEISIKIDLSERKVRLYANNHLEMTAPVAIGRNYWISGNFFLARCSENPIWYGLTSSDKLNLPKPGWNNPYGKIMCELATGATTSFAVSFKEDIANVRDERGKPVYGMVRLHHTDNPQSVGKMASHGCFRNDYVIMKTLTDVVAHYHGTLGTRSLGRGITTVYNQPVPISIVGNPLSARLSGKQ